MLLLINQLFVSTGSASVVMNNTRVILNDNYQERIQLTNKSTVENVIQIWTTDELNSDAKFGATTEPFIVSPQVFKIKPSEGQSVSLNYIGKDLPQDRESVFHLHMLQIPPVRKSNKSAQQLIVLQKTEIKIFYRPNIKGFNINKIDDYLTFTKNKAGVITCINSSPFFLNIVGGSISQEESAVNGVSEKLSPIMISPYSQHSWSINHSYIKKASKVRYTYVNDQGAFVGKENDIL